MHDTTCARRQMLLGLSHARPLLVPTPRPGVARQCPLAAALAAGGRRRRRNAAAEQAGEHAARWPSRPQEKASGPSDLSDLRTGSNPGLFRRAAVYDSYGDILVLHCRAQDGQSPVTNNNTTT